MNHRFFFRSILIVLLIGAVGCHPKKAPNSAAKTLELDTLKPATVADSLLFAAAGAGDLQLVTKLLNEHANADARGKGYANHNENGIEDASGRGWTALMYAAYNHHKDIVQLLLDHGADVNAQNDAGYTALLYACQANEAACALVLLDHKANPNVQDHAGNTPLYWAIAYQLGPLAMRLVELGSDVNATSTETGKTVLIAAYSDELPEVGDLLIAKGANVNAVNKNDGETALMRAAAQNYHKSVALLLEKGADVNVIARQSYTALAFASSNDSDDVRIPSLLIEKGATINFKQDIGFTALMEAAIASNINVARLLIEKGADVNAVSISRGKVTALKDAVFACDFELSKLLIAHGANVNSVTENGSSILLEAVWNEKNLALVNFLIEQGANVNLANEDGQTPLLKSVSYKDPAMVKLLLKHGADRGAKDVYGHTMYSLAQESGNKELIALTNGTP